jgi:hypothetical protein
LNIFLNNLGKFLVIFCFILAAMFPVENLYSNSSGNESGSVSKSSSYGNIVITTWADDRNSAFSFSFDDGFISHYVNVREILNQFDFKGTFYLLPPFLTDSLPGIWRYGTWQMFEEMSNEEHELGSHTLNHDTLAQLPVGDTLTPHTIHYEMYHSREMINERAPNQKCITFAYPFALHSSLVDSIASIYYESARAVGVLPNPSEIKGKDWYDLSSYQIEFNLPRNSPDDDLDELNAFIDWINNSISNGEWGIHLIHEVVPFNEIKALLGEGAYHPISNEWLTSLCSWLNTKSSNNEIWIQTIANITKYVKERESFNFNIISQNNTVIEIEVGDNLIDEIYDYPLTAYITVPPDWDYALLEQGSRTDVLESFIMDTSTVVIGKVIPDGGNVRISKFIPNSVTENKNTQPEDFVLSQNYPNPFNPITNIGFRVSEYGFVSLKIYDVLGNEIATLVNEEKPAGEYRVDFDASSLTSGIYIYTLHTIDGYFSKKMLLLK